jgi:hypothetical protein
MSDYPVKKAGRVEQARQRLDAAVARLEQALARRGEASAAPAAPAPDPDMLGELETLQQENDRLRAANENAGARLDATIGRLETLLID